MKRMIGRVFEDEYVQMYRRKWPFEVVAGERKNCEIKIPGVKNPYKVEEVTGHLLDYMKKTAERSTGAKIENAVISIPAYFSFN